MLWFSDLISMFNPKVGDTMEVQSLEGPSDHPSVGNFRIEHENQILNHKKVNSEYKFWGLGSSCWTSNQTLIYPFLKTDIYCTVAELRIKCLDHVWICNND